MYEFIQGTLVETTPAYAIIEQQGIGYYINISIYTYTNITGKKECRLYIHQAIREDAHVLFGFVDKPEREVFRQLISVSGVGPSTARMILSSMSPNEIRIAIQTADVNTLKGVKGIGSKTAERIIVDLKDKIIKTEGAGEILSVKSNTSREESLSALVALGFSRNAVEKVLDKLLSGEPALPVEEVVKKALKIL
jgi:holliday junction DNA helicase RuvA